MRRHFTPWLLLTFLGICPVGRLDAQNDSRAFDRRRDIERIVQDIRECRKFGGVLVLWEKFLGSTLRGHVRTLDRHLERDSADLEARYLRGLLNDYLGRDDEALQDLRAVAASDSDFAAFGLDAVYVRIGIILKNRREYSAAVRCFDQAFEADPDDGWPLIQKAWAYWEIDHSDSASDAYFQGLASLKSPEHLDKLAAEIRDVMTRKERVRWQKADGPVRRFGMGWMTMSDNLLGDNPFFDKGGWSAGFYAVKSFDTQTAIQLEAVYVRTGAQWEGADYQLDYIQFPVMFKFSSQEIEDRIGFLMGIYGAARVREKVKIGSRTYDVEDSSSSLDGGLVVGGTLGLPRSFNVEIRYVYGAAKVYKGARLYNRALMAYLNFPF